MNSFREPGRDWDCPRLRRQPTPCVAGARENRSLRLRRVPGTALCPGKLEGRGGVLCTPKAGAGRQTFPHTVVLQWGQGVCM